jgi:two-component system, NarL family, nitrate/nitrite response regulator NarL
MAAPQQIRTLFSTYDTSFLLRLSSHLDEQRDIRLTCVLQQSAAAVQMVRALQPDILLMDSGVPREHQASLLETIRTACARTRVVLFIEDNAEDAIIDALEHGVRGCLLKSCSPEGCLRAIRAVHAGEMWVGRKALAQLLENLRAVQAAREPAEEPPAGLTLRESEVLARIKVGMTNKEVARELGIGDTTVKTHLQHIFKKLHISRRKELWCPRSHLPQIRNIESPHAQITTAGGLLRPGILR